MTMPAGRYYVGDLCYVMTDWEWDEFCDITIKVHECVDGEFEFADGRRFATYGTAWGDGVYHSNRGTSHSVDAGLIGCIRIQDIQASKYEDLESLGAVVDFDQDFETGEDQGVIWFGTLRVDTQCEEAVGDE